MKTQSELIHEAKELFYKEWDELTNNWTEDNIPIGTIQLKVKFRWEIDVYPNYEAYLGKTEVTNECVVEEVVQKSQSYASYQNRITKFVENTEEWGKRNFNDPQYLWDINPIAMW
jgi:hypothetical protein